MVPGGMPEVLMVTKSMGPPWTDGTRVLVRDLVSHLARWEAVLLVGTGVAWRPPRGRVERLFGLGAPGYAGGWAERTRLMARLLAHGGERVRHFVFAPTAATAWAARLSRAIQPTAVVQTLPSRPLMFDPALLFGDRVVVPSRWSEARWRAAGVDGDRLRRIPPGVPLGTTIDAATRREARRALHLPDDGPLALYPGDLGPDAARTVHAFAVAGTQGALVLAARTKRPADAERARELAHRVRRRGLERRVLWVGEVPSFAALLAAVDVVVLPAIDTFAKVDLPLALVEAMARGLPVVVDDRGPAAELALDGAAWPTGSDQNLAEALGALLGDESLRLRIGAAGRARVADVHDPFRVAASYESLYDEVA